MRYLVILLFSVALFSCDPVHNLTLNNQSGNAIEVLYRPSLDDIPTDGIQIEKEEIQGQQLDKITLDSAEILRIGRVTAMYTPTADDVELDYLEIRNGQDTIRLTGKRAILSTIQKIESLDWRLVVK
ncbi:hypothetical protein [Sabulibacter ruber]|uniref:hypothetical protein n=1 Tax=Sabulibacter ruber TaxID=2811901 RepID=UPI001A956F07|nr:hypothetical protein [Sabulibacter ruber]